MRRDAFTFIPWLIAIMLIGLRTAPAESGGPSSNLIPLSLSEGKEGEFPPGFKEDASNQDKVHLDYKVFTGKRGPSMRVDLPKTGAVCLDLQSPVRLDDDTKYLFSVLVKVKDLVLDGPCSNEKGMVRGILMYVYSASGHGHQWAAVVGAGHTDGWVTVMLPFDTAVQTELKSMRIFLRCQELSGTVWFQDPVVIEAPAGFQMQPHFILENGETVPSNLLNLK